MIWKHWSSGLSTWQLMVSTANLETWAWSKDSGYKSTRATSVFSTLSTTSMYSLELSNSSSGSFRSPLFPGRYLLCSYGFICYMPRKRLQNYLPSRLWRNCWQQSICRAKKQSWSSWKRSLPGPLMSNNLTFCELLSCFLPFNSNWSPCIFRFPSPHRATLFSLLSHLEKVSGNKNYLWYSKRMY